VNNLNIRQLFGPLFFERDRRHPDMKRQRSRRRRCKALAAARRLKTQTVPLLFVAPSGRWEERLHGERWAWEPAHQPEQLQVWLDLVFGKKGVRR
jgi:hypothetical protein